MKKIWIISDGNAGHENQSKGYIQKKFETKEVDVEIIQVRLKIRGFLRPLFKFLTNLDVLNLSLIEKIYVELNLPKGKPQLIVSSAVTTAYLSIILAKKYHVDNIFLGYPNGFKWSLFTKIISHFPFVLPNHEYSNVLFNTIDPNVIIDKSIKYFGQHNKYPLFVIGGKSRSHRFTNDDWLKLAYFINSYAKENDTKVLISTSRRTGADVEKILLNNIESTLIFDAVWYNHEAKKILQEYYGMANEIFVTQDSMTMISEAIATLKRVILLVPNTVVFRKKKDDHYVQFINYNEDKNIIQKKIILSEVDYGRS